MAGAVPTICGLGLYDAAVINRNKARGTTPLRLVSLYEIEYVLEDGGISHINGKEYPLRRGAVIVAKPGYQRHTELPFKALYTHFIIEDTVISDALSKCPDFFIPENPECYERALGDLILAYSSDSPYKDITVGERIFSLLSLVTSNISLLSGSSDKSKGNVDIIKRAIEYMDSNLSRDLTLDDVARSVHLSRIYFRSIFLAATGQTPYKYIMSKRLSLAKQMILTTDKSFSQIALECGFSSQSYMNSVFRRELSKTPREFKEESSLLY